MSTSGLVATRIRASYQKLAGVTASRGTTCSFCSAGSGSKKRRRNKISRPLSKKDRIRSLEKKPAPEPFRMQSVNDVSNAGETLVGRLAQAQDFVWSLWRNRTGSTGPRPARVGPVMDRRWWFLNILLMSVPGILLGLYCEFKAKPEMIQILGGIEELEKARILGEGLEGEEDVMEADASETLQEIKDLENEGADEIESEGNGALLALKRRMDALEAQLAKKDRQLDHLRKYQWERSQQSGVRNRSDDKMAIEWSSQRKPPTDTVDIADADMTFSERMKKAVVYGISENMKARKEELQRYGRNAIDWVRDTVSDKNAPEPDSQVAENPSSVTKRGAPAPVNHDKHSNQTVINAVNTVINASIPSKDPMEMTQAAKEASDAATLASRAAQEAAEAVPREASNPGFLSRQWNSLVGGSKRQSGGEADPNPPG